MGIRKALQKILHKILSWVPCEKDQGHDGHDVVLPGAHDFVINQLSIGVKEEADDKENALRELKERSISGAEFNSAERDTPPRCHPGTRTSLREQLRAHIENAELGTRIIWIHGAAGVGKSAIMQTVVEEMSPDVLCATLFFSRPNRRDDARKVFTTLAYSLAVTNPEYCQYVGMRLKADPACLSKSLDAQFRTLFVVPFTGNHVAAASRRWVVFLDGLDECQNTEDSDNQCRILNLICDSIFDHARSIPFVWVIASRPEENLKKSWSRIRDRFQGRDSNLWEVVVPVDSDEATKDVELYLHKEFEKIKENYSELVPEHSRWPSDGDFVKIAKKSSGLFVFASTVIKYVSHEDPVYRLGFIVSLIDQAEQCSADDEKPFNMLDLLYSSIMSDVPKRLLHAAKSLIGFYHLADTVAIRRERDQAIGLITTCNILGLRQNEAYAALRKLQSVLICPLPKAAQVNGISFYHASFLDFLFDHSRSKRYHINLDQEFTNILQRYTTIIRQSTTVLGHAGINISWLPDEVFLGQHQHQLLQTAQASCMAILGNGFSSRPTTKSLQVGVAELIEILQTLGLAFLAGGKSTTEEFLNSLDEGTSVAIQDRMVFKALAPIELDTERLVKCLCNKRRYRIMIDSTIEDACITISKNLGVSQWGRLKQELWTTSSELAPVVEAHDSQTGRVIVVGKEPSDLYAIIGPLDGAIAYYILPYHVG